MSLPDFGVPSCPSESTHFMTPPGEQTICSLSDAMAAMAMDAPRNSANQASTRPAISFELRMVAMAQLSHCDLEHLSAGRALAVERDLVVLKEKAPGQKRTEVSWTGVDVNDLITPIAMEVVMVVFSDLVAGGFAG